MKSELSKIVIGTCATSAVLLPGFFTTPGAGCTGLCGNCGGTCIGGIFSGLGVLSLYCYKKTNRKIIAVTQKTGEHGE